MIWTFLKITWRPEFGDPNLLGWSITILYLFAGFACWMAGWNRRTEPWEVDRQRIAWLWFILALIMIGLGINKQLDLQKLLIEIGREFSKMIGWHARRKLIQAVFVVGLATAGILLAISSLYLIRNRWAEFGLPVIGIVVLLTFVILRAASINHVGQSIARLSFYETLNAALELGGAALITTGAFMAIRLRPISKGFI